MKTETVHNTSTTWRSEARPDVCSGDARLAEAIAWADANPHAWKIVTGTKSKAFGRGSCVYIGWAQRSMAPDAILERARQLHDLVSGKDAFHDASSIFAWRATFTFQRYKDAGFTGGFFQQHDGKYPRLCLSLDYTPDTLESVIDRFLQWCQRDYRTDHITVDGRVVRRVEGA